MLFNLWQQVVREQANEVALWDAASGRRWTFRALDNWSERWECPGGGEGNGAVFPMGMGPEFILGVLRGWRTGVPVCPLEEGQGAPNLKSLPAFAAHLKTTSATTDGPRLIVFRGEQLVADVENICATMGLRRGWPNLAAISLGHSYGFSSLVLPLLLKGIPLVLCGSGMPEALRRGAKLVSSATLAGVPVLWRQWLDAEAVPQRVQLAISAGAPLPPALEQEACRRFGLRIHNFYGASECGGIAYDRSPSPRDDPSLVGEPMNGVAVCVSAEGTLQVRGDAVGETYWPEPESSLGQGVFRTTDLAELKSGCVFLRGRAADLIHVSGRKFAPERVEQVLAEHPAVQECIVLGLPHADPVRGERIAAVVVPREPVSEEDLADHLRKCIPEWQIPRRWEFKSSLGANVRGKTSRTRWRERLMRDERR